MVSLVTKRLFGSLSLHSDTFFFYLIVTERFSIAGIGCLKKIDCLKKKSSCLKKK